MFCNAKYRHSIGAVGSAALLAVSIALSGCERPASEAAQDKTEAVQSTPSTSTSGDNAVRAYIDPATGQLREPTPEDIAAQNAAEAAKKPTANASSEKTTELKEIHHPGGAVEIQLGDSAQQSLQGCVAPNGDVKMDHECEAKQDGKKR